MMFKIDYSRTNQNNCQYQQSGVNEHHFVDANLRTHIVTKFFIDVN